MRAVFLFIAATLSLGVSLSAAQPRVTPEGYWTNGWFELGIHQPESIGYSIQRSPDLQSWKSIALLHGRETLVLEALPFVDPGASTANAQFYSVRTEAITFESDWRNQVFQWNDPFRSEPIQFGIPETRWIKFAILTNEPTRVYYQSSWKYSFHYDFAVARLAAFKGLTPAQFDAVSLRTNGQRLVLGTILFPPKPEINEVGVQFVGQDAYRPEQIAEWFEIVRCTIVPLHAAKVLYMPTYEQAPTAEANRDYFQTRGIELSSASAWDSGDSVYSSGWAIGRLKFFPSSQVQKAYENGELGPNDILLTDGIPAELPYVAGIITLAPSTPNSHVALLARSYGVPFVYLSDSELRERAQSLVGKEAVLSGYAGPLTSDIQILDVTSADTSLKEELAAIKKPTAIQITPKTSFGAYTSPTELLVPADTKYFGGKAANFGFLRRTLPTNSPVGIAISFDLWDEFLDQRLTNGLTLREDIRTRLAKHSYPPNFAALASDLKAIRDEIEDQTLFTTQQQQKVAEVLLGKFDPNKKIRFRSSTNVEDSEEFVGAGLYDSYSGCLADDLDADGAGPSLCDATENKERGVFRAIRKVYASFYNDNAVLERMRHLVDEAQVGMAVLVHYSNPDEEELANGVATVTFEKRDGNRTFVANMVTQKGAVSVTNPDGSALPEVVSVSKYFSTPYASLRQGSTLVPLGSHVLNWTSEYEKFCEMFATIAHAFEDYSKKTNYILDFEYKKIVPGELLVKQVRELPPPKSDAPATYLLNSPSEWSVFQGEYGDVFANHRLKAKLQLSTKNVKLTTNALGESLFGPIVVQYADANEIKSLTGVPSSFPAAKHRVGDRQDNQIPVSDHWTLNNGTQARTVALTLFLPVAVSVGTSPIQSLDRLEVSWNADYSQPLPTILFEPEVSQVISETVRLVKTPQTNSASLLVTRTIPSSAGAAISTSFFWPEPPTGVVAGYTAPLQAWKETRIEGLTMEPIVLHGYYSQTYRPEHHNFGENFIFEPALEPGIPASILAELDAKNIHYIYVHWGGEDFQSTIWVADHAWNLRALVQKTARSAEP